MEFFKEIYDAWGARVKSRVFGSIIVAFTVINWKVLFFLVFDDGKVIDKFAYFDEHTNALTLYIWPIFLGGLIGLVLPYVNNWTHWYVSKPVSAMRSRDDEYAHERLKKKNEWLIERKREQDLLEQSVVDQAKRDAEIEEIGDFSARKAAQEKIQEIRENSRVDPLERQGENSDDINIVDVVVLNFIDGNEFDFGNRRSLINAIKTEKNRDIANAISIKSSLVPSRFRIDVEVTASVAKLVRNELVTETEIARTKYRYRVTMRGYKVLDQHS